MRRVPDIKRKLIVPVTEPLVSDLRFIRRHKGRNVLPRVHGLALKARSALAEEELQSISPLSRWRN
jgi:hypothetical protein